MVSNASAWDTLRLLSEEHVSAEWRKSVEEMPRNRSFMHAHVGFDATGEKSGAVGCGLGVDVSFGVETFLGVVAART